MLIENINITNGAKIGIWKIEENVETLTNLLSNKEYYFAELSKIGNENRKKEFLIGRILVQNLSGETQEIFYDNNGKPLLKSDSHKISISHTKNYVCVIIHTNKEVGIDIEHIKDKIKSVQNRFLNKKELQNIDNTQEISHLLLHWCAKEVLFKIINKKNVDFSKHMEIKKFTPQTQGFFEGEETRSKEKKTYTFEYRIKPEYIIVWSIKN